MNPGKLPSFGLRGCQLSFKDVASMFKTNQLSSAGVNRCAGMPQEPRG